MEKNSVLMLLFMSFHFTQFCAFLTYSFRFMGYYSCFYRGKDTFFFKDTREKTFFPLVLQSV